MRCRWGTWIAVGLMAGVISSCAETDAGITTKVKAALVADDTVKAFQIDVDTRDKVVTLKGNVDSAAAKARAVTVAQGTEGVASVVDNITVTVKETPPDRPLDLVVTDAALTAAVKTKLLGDLKMKGLKIDVDSKEGVVTLTGTVPSQTAKDDALRLARETTSVRNVVDKLTIAP